MLRRLFIAVVLSLVVSDTLATTVVKNHVFILFDLTKTYEHRDDASRFIEEFVAAAQVVERDPRRQPTSQLTVTLISIDSFPRVVFSGSEYELQGLDLNRLIEDRRGYGGCSDVATALQVLAEHLPADRCATQPTVYLLTDFRHEPPLPSGRCKPASYSPTGMPLAALSGVPVRALFVPPAASNAWEPALRALKLTDTFRMHPTAGPEGRLVVPPPARRCAPGAAGRQAVVSRLTKTLLAGAALVFAAVAAPMLYALRRRG